MEFLEDGKITFTYITKQDEKEVNAEEGDHEGLVEIGRDVEGVEVSVFLRELDNGTYKASFRSLKTPAFHVVIVLYQIISFFATV